ncbi:unnamed protein product, partial [marine sediment metagenome]
MKWIEGIHYSKGEDGTLECLNCGRKISGMPGLGPHLTSCWKPEDSKGAGVGSKGRLEEVPEEHGFMVELLTDHGVKRAKAIADLLSYQSWDDFSA